METRTDYSEVLTTKKYFSNIWNVIRSTAKGMAITIGYVVKEKEVTLQYPEEREVLPANTRARLYNDVENCTACSQCASICPVNCIYIASKRMAKDAPPKKADNGMPIRMELTQYTIDTALCCYCGLCTTVCPTECITHTKNFEYSKYEVDEMKYDFLSSKMRSLRTAILAEREE
jgi:NADH-quinone oxidoreductase subunit I